MKANMKTIQSVSIVIPVYNEENHLKNCLDAISAQIVKPDEVIIVDNKSTDQSRHIAKKYPFVRLIVEKRQGVLFARNTGFNAAQSDIIARIDADTQLPPSWVARIKKIFTNDTIAAVSGPVGFHDVPIEGLVIDKNMRKAAWRIGKKNKAVFLFGSNMAMRRSAWELIKNTHCKRKDIHEDIDLAIHLDEIGQKVVFDEKLVAHTSSRRMSDPPLDFYKYLQIYKNTYAVHNIQSSAVTLTTMIVLSAQPGVKLLRRSYDPNSKQFSFKKFIKNQDEARIHPMG